MSKLNHEAILTKITELNKIDTYIPLALHRYISQEYYDRVDEKGLKQYYKVRTGLQRASNPSKYLEDDLKSWLKKHKEFEDILIDG